ncbi:MAG: DUF2163 domain-containing protein [Paracoccaceae bacterium]
MRSIPAGIQAALDAGAATLCYCWQVTLADGREFGFTNHDRSLSFDGIEHAPQSGFTPSEVELSLGLAISTDQVEGVLDSAVITEDDLRAGLWDNATITLYLVDWSAIANRMLLRVGSIGQVRNSSLGFAAELRGQSHALNQAGGRFYNTVCDAALGDVRCGVDLTDDRYKGVGAVASSDGAMHIYPLEMKTVSNNAAEGLFSRGKLVFTSGANSGLAFGIRQHIGTGSDARLVLDGPTPFEIADGDSFTATVGCDKLMATCHRIFANRLNFRGFNLIPGNDRILRPVDQEDEYANDGSSVFSGPVPTEKAAGDTDNPLSLQSYFGRFGLTPPPFDFDFWE